LFQYRVASHFPSATTKRYFCHFFLSSFLHHNLVSSHNMNLATDFSQLGSDASQPDIPLDFGSAASASPPAFDTHPAWSSSVSNAPHLPSTERNSRVKLWCDRVSNKFNLKPEQYNDLHVFVDVRVLVT
jgi:hypothetical protein